MSHIGRCDMGRMFTVIGPDVAVFVYVIVKEGLLRQHGDFKCIWTVEDAGYAPNTPRDGVVECLLFAVNGAERLLLSFEFRLPCWVVRQRGRAGDGRAAIVCRRFGRIARS